MILLSLPILVFVSSWSYSICACISNNTIQFGLIIDTGITTVQLSVNETVNTINNDLLKGGQLSYTTLIHNDHVSLSLIIPI